MLGLCITADNHQGETIDPGRSYAFSNVRLHGNVGPRGIVSPATACERHASISQRPPAIGATERQIGQRQQPFGVALGNFMGAFFTEAFLGLEPPTKLVVSAEPTRGGALVRWNIHF